MTVVTGDIRLVTDNPAQVSQVWLRAARPRVQGTAYVTESPDVVALNNGRVTFDVLPGAALMTLMQHGQPMSSVKLLVPDKSTATLRECIEAAGLVDDGTFDALELLAQGVAADAAKVGTAAQVGTWAEQAEQAAQAAEAAMVDKADLVSGRLSTEQVPEYLEPDSLTQTQLLASPHIDARVEGLWSVTSADQDAAPMLNAAADRARAEHRPLYIPAPKNLIAGGDGTSAYSIFDTVDFRYLDVYCDANIIVRHTNSPGVIVGDDANKRNGRKIRLGNVKHANTGYFDWDWTHPAVRVIGLMNGAFEMANCSLLELYADGDFVSDRSIAYSGFRLQRVNHLRLHGVNRGWINENTFYGGSYNRITLRGDYPHDANTWLKPSLEGSHSLFDFQCGYSNAVSEARTEGGTRVRFSKEANRNTLSSLYMDNIPIIHSGFVIEEDLGQENIVTTVASQNHAPHTLFSLSSSMFLTDTASELARENVVTPALPGGKLRVPTGWQQWIDTGLIPLESESDYGAPNINRTMAPRSRVTRFNISCDKKAMIVSVYFYSAQGALIRPAVTESMHAYAAWAVASNGNYYYTPTHISGLPIVVSNGDAKYMRITVVSANVPTDARLVDHVTLTAYVPEGSVPTTVARMRDAIRRPLFGTTKPTKGVAWPGATIQGPAGAWRSVARVDTTVTDVLSPAELALDSATGIEIDDVIGVLMSSGETHWAKVASKSGDAVTLDTAPPTAVSVGAAVGTTRWVYVADAPPAPAA